MKTDVYALESKVTMVASEVVVKEYDLSAYKPDWNFSAQISVVGDGTFKVQQAITNMPDRTLYNTDADIITGAVAGGHHRAELTVPTTKFLKLTITETGGTDGADINLVLIVR